MLVSHRYKFIFIKTLKTAGTSVEVELSKLMAPDDVVTRIFPLENGHVARNFEVNGKPLYNHMTAKEVRRAFGPGLFNDYFKFCVEREPVDKCVSHYSMVKNSPHHNEGSRDLDWDASVRRGRFPVDHRKYTDIWGRLIVDRILRYESLDSDLREVMAALGVSFAGLTAFAKSGYRKTGVAVTEEQRRVIYAAFRKSLRHTSYSA
jgi:hypothetical protein